ncbi:MAG: hypothetical protein N4A37_04960 [Prolixibacteraceae bacterium]|nr:hypothetical protein [Prolixibacteraceae bacterium]
MRRLIMITVLLLHIVSPLAAKDITLDDCQTWSRQVYPILRSQELYRQIYTKSRDLIHYKKYPSIALNSEVKYLSDVPHLDISTASFTFPELTKEQYSLFVEMHQSLYDGGIKEIQQDMLLLNDSISQLTIEMELVKLEEQIELLYCQILLSQQKCALFQQQYHTLMTILKEVNTCVAQGKALRFQKHEIEVQLLVCSQERDKYQDEYHSLCRVLSVLCGNKISLEEDHFIYPSIELCSSHSIPNDILFLRLQQDQYNFQNKLVRRQLVPKINIWGKAGYGKPGLNFMDNSATPYYAVGLALVWKPFDWNNNERKRMINRLNVSLYEARIDQKKQIREAHEVELLGNINSIKKQIIKDNKIISLREKIAVDLKKQWLLRTIPFSIYIDGMNNVTDAKIHKELHLIQKIEATLKYNRFLKQS